MNLISKLSLYAVGCLAGMVVMPKAWSQQPETAVDRSLIETLQRHRGKAPLSVYRPTFETFNFSRNEDGPLYVYFGDGRARPRLGSENITLLAPGTRIKLQGDQAILSRIETTQNLLLKVEVTHIKDQDVDVILRVGEEAIAGSDWPDLADESFEICLPAQTQATLEVFNPEDSSTGTYSLTIHALAETENCRSQD